MRIAVERAGHLCSTNHCFGKTTKRWIQDKFLFIAKGGGSANKTYLYQGTPSLLTHDRLIALRKEKILTLGTSAIN
jgi:tartrate dehydratase alpha subunit/fumarate hydratase class I-like protein